MTQTQTATREQWLQAAVEQLRPILEEAGEVFGAGEIPQVRVSTGWPSKGGTRSKGKVIGECWKGLVANDGVPHIFISPILGPTEPVKLLGVLAHEMIHAWDDCQSGHKGRFARTARAIGLEGKMTATVVGEALEERLTGLLEDLGPYPHAAINFEEMEKQRTPQTTRMLKLECPEDGYIVRTTAKWLDSMGAPKCPCGQEMEAA